MPPLRFTLLGMLNIQEAGQPAPLLRSRRGCALLAYLIVTRKAQSREVVADLLWESSSTSLSLTRLRVLLSRLRDWLPADVTISRQSLAFQPAETTQVDLYAFLDGLNSPGRDELDQALQFYGGELMADFYLEDAPRFNEWLLVERERLRQQVRIAYERLCVAYAAAEEWPAATDAARRWLALDDLDEAGGRWLMRLLAEQGQPAAALEVYETQRQRLWQEVAAEPETVTAGLADQVRAQMDSGQWSDVVVVQPWQAEPLPDRDSLSPPGLLPPHSFMPYPRYDDFRGREESLRRLADGLLPWPETENELPRPLAVTGMGGLGKTQLAVEFAYRYGRFYAGGVYWISFAEAGSVADEVARVGGERGMRLYQAADRLPLADRVERVQRAWQETIPRLLIFDDCGDEALLEQWLPVSGGCRILLTSRRGLWSRALRVNSIPLSIFSPAESIALLQQMAPEVEGNAAAEIAREVGHLPLALHLAGGFLRHYPQIRPARYLAQLRDAELLAHPSLRGRVQERSPTGHELDVARTFAISLEKLDADDEVDAFALRLLARAAAFAPGVPLAQDLLLATAVEDDADVMLLLTAEEGLARLVTLGFLAASGPQSLVMHQLLVAFARSYLGPDMTAEQDVERIVHERLDRQNQEKGSLFELPLAQAHVRFLLERALQRGDTAAADLAFLFGVHLNLMADFDSSQQYLQRGTSIYETVCGAEHPDTAKYLIGLGLLYNRSGHYWKARSIYERVLAIREEKFGYADKPTANALNNLGYQLILQGDYENARLYLERALAIELAEPDHPRIATVWKNLGTVALAQGKYDQAATYLDNSLVIREETLGPDHPYTASCLEQIGRLHLRKQEFEEAQRDLARALAILEQTLGENHPHTARSLNGLGALALACGDFPAAQAYLDRALASQEAVFTGDHPDMGITYRYLGDLYLALAEEERAAVFYQRAVAILEQHVLADHPDLQRAREQLRQSGLAPR